MYAETIIHTRMKKIYIVLMMLLSVTMQLFAVGWTPTDGGLVVDLEQGDRFLLSVVVNGKEYFVCNYNRYTGGDFKYASGLYLKLIPQAADATKPSDMSIWTVGAPLNRVIGGKNYDLGGHVYTIWNDGKTLKTFDDFKFLGDLTSDYNDSKAVDVVFVVPTDQESRTSFDPNRTLYSVYGRTDQAADGKINGKMGKGFLGMTYREVYMLDIPKQNSPISYTNASLVTFNTRDKQQSWSQGQIKCDPGHAAYAYADNKHKPTHRTLFRLYLLDMPFNYCDSYFFATDIQDFKNYRSSKELPGDSTAKKKIYTIDWMNPMTAVDKASSTLYKTENMYVPTNDSTYYYVGYNNDYRDDPETMGAGGAHSRFEKIRTLPLLNLPSFKAPADAYGKMVVDTTSSDANLGVKFEPAGYFLKVSTGTNVRMHKIDDNTWRSEEMWTITGEYAALHIKTMLMTGPQFREDDPGAAVEGWTKWVRGDSVPTSTGGEIAGLSGYAQITVNNTDSNGHMVFILADQTKWIRYDNNGFMGLEMPLQYPLNEGTKKVVIMKPRIKPEYTFLGWDTQADGNGTRYQEGDEFTFSGDGEVKLYAQARYDGTLQMAISFMQGDKRYFLTHPGTATPRYARARHFEHWENTWQGMEDAENLDPNYLSTYELRCPIAEIHKKEGDIPDLLRTEHVLDPRHYTMKGYTDSLTFYETFTPNKDEYLGLYYDEAFNTVLANNTWAGLFKTTSTETDISWPNYMKPYIGGTKILSTRYVEEYAPEDPDKKDSLILKVRWNKAKTDTIPYYVKYNSELDQFDGGTEGEATTFDISAVIVADEHYIILPDTSHVWQDTIEFGFHKNEQISEDVWSSVIGKQLMAVMMIDKDTIYFHPNRNKIINDPNDLYLSPDFRVTQLFEWIPDSRVNTTIEEGDSAHHEATDYYWHHNIVSGMNSPIDVKDKSGNYIDIIDTFRIYMSHDAISKIKEYRGRWNKDAAGLEVDNVSGSMRHRDIIVRTKTYHHGTPHTRLVLRPKQESYSFGPLKGQTQTLEFVLVQETFCGLFDCKGDSVGEDVTGVEILTSQLAMIAGGCSLQKSSSSHFEVNAAELDKVTLRVTKDNTVGVDYDTLIITRIKVDGVEKTVNVRVPLMQAALTTNELIWSVYDKATKKRYYIMAIGKDGSYALRVRQFTLSNSMLYQNGTKNQLVKGSDEGDNTDTKYITPWTFAYPNIDDSTQVTLLTESGINKYFNIESETGTVGTSASTISYRFANVYTNDNANYEEQVRLKYGATNKWLKFNTGATPTITLQEDSASATVFSWSYLLTEYSLLNDGSYPSQNEASFGYDNHVPKAIQTKYKAQREYSTLLDNTVTYLCRKEETKMDSLTAAIREWKTLCTIDTIRDHRVATKSGLTHTIDDATMTTEVNAPGDSPSPMDIVLGGKYIDIVDTLRVRLSLQGGAPAYRFKGDWSKFQSVSDANLKIPMIRKTYHTGSHNALSCGVEGDANSFTFHADSVNKTHEYKLSTFLTTGSEVLDVDENVVAIIDENVTDVTSTCGMDLTNKNLAEVRLIDIYGNTPDWCEITAKTTNTITVKCTKAGIRSPRSAYIYLAYIVTIADQTRFINYRLTVSQSSSFTYKNNQVLIHSNGASGDEKMANGMQQVHTNKRVLYYYPEQAIELPVRERAFYGWWRWYREGVDVDSVDVSDSDIPDSLWYTGYAPKNEGKYIYPYRTIGDSVMLKKKDGTDSVKVLVTMGRWTVFHYRSKDYNNKQDPPAKNPRIWSPDTMRVGVNRGKYPVMTYAVDLSNYYDNLPMSVKDKNQVDIDLLDTILEINEPTLSLREVFELHPWTEMAARLNGFKSERTTNDAGDYELADERYMEDHEMMAPTGYQLLLQTEQRYRYDHLAKHGHAESQLGYYMRDDNWGSMSAVKDEYGWSRQDSMIWCGGWDADCKWYTYDPSTKKYTACNYEVTEEEDFLKVPARNATGTVYYCLRARSRKSTHAGTPGDPDPAEPEEGDYMFNICRYKIIYHHPAQYGPLKEATTKGETKALITKEEIEQRYEVLERLDFDYIKPGSAYHVYSHPLPWADASYGYTYPETSSLPHNRYHDESDFPNHGEYGLINRIPYGAYWRKMEQHGGAANGYMIYCDGMSSAGQVATLTLNTTLCAGQKMFFSGYVGNPSSQTGKANPNFIFSVQGSLDGEIWDDITSYMTGDIPPASEWYQIYFPILHTKEGDTEYTHFRVRIYNVASSFDGNDFIIDDMCIFATKPPLIAYQAQTTCSDYGHSEEDTHMLLRIDYQGITGEGYNGKNVCYTVQQKTKAGAVSFINPTDGYLKDSIAPKNTTDIDTIFGKIYIPTKVYEPQDKDSIYKNMNDLLDRFDSTLAKYKDSDKSKIVREGYIYEILEGDIRPVKYIVHSARMESRNDYMVHMSGTYKELLSSICGMTSYLKISNRMVLELNGEEQPETEQLGLCANATYDIGLRVKGSFYRDSVAPIDVEGTCINDWLLYGDTARASSLARYGYTYSDILKVVKNLRYEEIPACDNDNQFAPNLSSVKKDVMSAILAYDDKLALKDTDKHPYDVLTDLVNKGHLILYKSQLTASVLSGDSVQYVILPIVGTGSEVLTEARVEVCPNPILIKLKPDKGGAVPLMVGGLKRDSTESTLPVEVLTTAAAANAMFKLRVDSIMERVGIYSIDLRTTDDPDYREGVHLLQLTPDKRYPAEDYYEKGDSITLRPASTNNYSMKPGYNYTFNIVMQTWTGQLEGEGGCKVGTVPFTVSIVPDYVRWDPQSATNNNWNDADNWIGIDADNEKIHDDAHFVPMQHTMVLIPTVEEGKPYPVVQPLPTAYEDSIQKVGFQYNQCNTIRFMPNAAIGNQQYINNTDVVIDMSMPNKKWALRSSPVKGMVSGDLFMANADNNGTTPMWEVGEFDATGRTYQAGNASFWLSVYSRNTIHMGADGTSEARATTAADWSKVTNGITLSLPEASGWAVYARTSDNKDAAVRLPKRDDIYYYYNGTDKLVDSYETITRASGAGDLAFHPVGDHQDYTISNDGDVASTSFVFGNPTMGYIDIWGFIADNRGALGLADEFGYLDESEAASIYRTVNKATAEGSANRLSTRERYLPPMHAIILTASSASSFNVTLKTNRVVTDTVAVARPLPAPHRAGSTALRKGIMTITAMNPCSPRCTSYLLLGQGYHAAIRDGEDAMLTTLNIDKFSMTNTPTTPFNIYAVEGDYGLSIDLRDELINVPISFYMSDMPYDPVTNLWFTGVNKIDGELVLYDAQTNTERSIIDGICLKIETPQTNHQTRYYIRRRGFNPQDPTDPVATDIPQFETDGEQAIKILQNGHVLILRNGHVYTMFGQKWR